MDKSAIQQIQESANIPAIIETLKGTKTPVVAMPESMGIHSLEKYMENASRYRLSLDTPSFDDFVEYIQEHDSEGAICFVDGERMLAQTVFDLGTIKAPGHKEHSAILQLKQTAAYAAIVNISGQELSQKEASEFLEDWADFITVSTSSNEGIPVHKAAAILRDLTIESAKEVTTKVDDFGASMSGMERVEAKNKNQIPAELSFSCVPFLSFEARTLYLRVSILTGGQAPKIKFRIKQLEALREKLSLEFKQKISNSAYTAQTKVYIGSI